MVDEPSLRAAKKERTRRTIAEAALRLFLARGFEEVSIAEIAEAAQVSKMTVFNYFPAKEDLFFEFTHGTMPDLAAAVRGRYPGEAPIAALHRFVRAELVRHAEWTGLHDGVADFARLVFASPTLLAGFGKIWHEREEGLSAALAEAVGVELPDERGEEEAPAALPTSADPLILRIAVGQIVTTVQNLVAVNQERQGRGITVAESTDRSLLECDAAFGLLENGLGRYGQ